jgi:N-acetylneuraminic acid mutarotase
MSKLNTAVAAALFSLALFSSCTSSNSYTYGEWKTKADFDGKARYGAASFVIGDYGYVVGGYNGKTVRLSDVWRYSFTNNSWEQVASMPGTARREAVGFSADGYGFVTTGEGYDATTQTTVNLRDTWKFDPSGSTTQDVIIGTDTITKTVAGTWVQVANFPYTGRKDALSISFSDEGIVGCGYNDDGYLKDMYSYSPTTDTWSTVTFPGSKRQGGAAVAFSDSVAYVGFGYNSSGYNYDFWKYNRKTDTWTQERDIADRSSDSYDDDYGSLGRTYPYIFAFNNKVYIACGLNSSTRGDYWEYTPSTDLWNQDSFTPITKHSIATARYQGVSFCNGKRGILTTGRASTYYYDNTIELVPDVHDDDD